MYEDQTNASVPVNELNQMYDGFGNYDQWFSQLEDQLL